MESISISPVVSSTPPQVSLVSIQAINYTEAEVVVKTVQGVLPGSWRLLARDATGKSVGLTADSSVITGPFSLIPMRLKGLVVNEKYTFELNFRYNNTDTVTALRSYTHRLTDFTWRRLAHAPLDYGDYSACPVADKYGNLLLGRYKSLDSMQAWVYVSPFDKWIQNNQASLLKIQPRRGLIQCNLFYYQDLHYMYGLGYAINDQTSNKYFYYHDLWTVFGNYDGPVVPQYQGEDGEVAFFITRDSLTSADEVFFLTQNGSSAMRSINVNFPQVSRAPLPEVPGTLAAFTLNNIGYVVNQQSGQPIHLWAYDPKADRWERRADFPGTSRSRGVGFAFRDKGYFGLGVQTISAIGLRDVWQYDPSSNSWQYVTDYPGQGNRYLAALSTTNKVYIGWGYESQQTTSGIVRQVPCTDWWSFTF